MLFKWKWVDTPRSAPYASPPPPTATQKFWNTSDKPIKAIHSLMYRVWILTVNLIKWQSRVRSQTVDFIGSKLSFKVHSKKGSNTYTVISYITRSTPRNTILNSLKSKITLRIKGNMSPFSTKSSVCHIAAPQSYLVQSSIAWDCN